METIVLIVLPILALLVVVAALMNLLPQNAAVIVPALALLAMVFIAYRTSFRGPKVRLEPMPVDGFKHYMSSGYSNGMPSTWNIKVRLLGTNDSPRTGYLTNFAVDVASLEHAPRKPIAFNIDFSGLESHVSYNTTLPVSLPVILQPRASQELLFLATLTFTSGPGNLADDLRELSGFTVTYRYRAGRAGKPKEREGTVSVSYGQLRDGVRGYWGGASQYAQWVRRLEQSGGVTQVRSKTRLGRGRPCSSSQVGGFTDGMVAESGLAVGAPLLVDCRPDALSQQRTGGRGYVVSRS